MHTLPDYSLPFWSTCLLRTFPLYHRTPTPLSINTSVSKPKAHHGFLCTHPHLHVQWWNNYLCHLLLSSDVFPGNTVCSWLQKWSYDVRDILLTAFQFMLIVLPILLQLQQMLLQQQQQRLFYGPLSGTTRVSRQKKKHSPTHHPDQMLLHQY